MFRNLTIYKMAGLGHSLDLIEHQMSAHGFVACTPTQDKSIGWVPARGEDHGALAEVVAGQLILKLMIETKRVPASEIKKKVKEAADAIEASTGRKPGKKERKALADDALLALLPVAFPRRATVVVWLDRERNLLLLDSSNQTHLDDAVTALVRTFDGLMLTQFNTNTTPAAFMTALLSDEEAREASKLQVGRDVELRSADEEKAVVRFTRHHLLSDEVSKHVAEGKLPTRLAVTWEDRASFVLNDRMQLLKITYLDVVADEKNQDEAGVFDTNVAIGTGEMRSLLPDLIADLGGEYEPKSA